MSELLQNMSKNDVARGYPERFAVLDEQTDWDVRMDDYDPAYFADQRVLSLAPEMGDLENPALISNLATSISGELRFDPYGRPLHPLGRTGIYGKGLLYYYGPNICADLLNCRGDVSELEIVTGIRKDNGKRAFTGGFQDRSRENRMWVFEDPLDSAIREHSEEAGLDLKPYMPVLEFQLAYSGIVRRSARCTDNAWLESYVFGVDVSGTPVAEMEPVGGDDLVEGSAQWTKVSDLDPDAMHDDHGLYLEKYLELRQLTAA